MTKTNQGLLKAEQILSAPAHFRDVEIPEWGGTVRLRAMTAAEAMDFFERSKVEESGAMVEIVAECLVDENLAPLFTSDQVDGLKQQSLSAFVRLQKVFLELNRVDDIGVQQAGNASSEAD